jgi:hypothetical protein
MLMFDAKHYARKKNNCKCVQALFLSIFSVYREK